MVEYDMHQESHRRRKLKRPIVLKILALLTAMTLFLSTESSSANANEVTTWGSQSQWYEVYSHVPRYNTHSINRIETRFIESGHGGGYLRVRYRSQYNPPVGTYFSQQLSYNHTTWYKIVRIATGSTIHPQGTFYTSTQFRDVMCGGDGCGLMNWKFSLRWNLQHPL